jgi:hypothetical protein
MAYGGVQGARFNGVANFARTASVPEGYAPGGSHVLPRKAGGMVGAGHQTLTGSGSLLQGGLMSGGGSMALSSADGSLSLTVGMTGVVTLTWTTSPGTLSLTIGMGGSGSFSIAGAGGLSMIVPFDGSGSFSLDGAADLKGRLSMAGEWTPYTELSPENLAKAVWDAVAAQYNEPGTTGAKLNTASSGGVDLSALAQAVWQHAQRELTALPPGAATETTAAKASANAALAAALSA